MTDIIDLGFRVDSGDLERAEKRMNDLDDAGKGVEGRSTGVISSFKAIGTAAVAASGVLGLGKLVSTSSDFQASMNDVQEKLNLTGNAMDEVRQFALEMGSSTAFSASQAADAMSELAALGLSASESMETLPDVLDLASSSGLALSDAASKTAITLNQFGLDVGESTRVVDLLAGAADAGAANVDFLTTVFSKSGPQAALLGVSMEEVAAAAGLLADKGVAAEISGTALRNVMDLLLNPSDQVAKNFRAAGIEMEEFTRIGQDGKSEFIGLGEAFDVINDSGADVPDLMGLLGREISSLIPVVLAGSDGLEEQAAAMEASASASEQAKTKMQGLPGAFTSLTSAFEGFQLALLGGTGADIAEAAIRTLANTMRDWIPILSGAHDSVGDFLDRLNGVGSLVNAQAGPALDGIYGVINRIRDAVQPLVPHIKDFGVALAAMGATATVIGVVGLALSFIGGIVLTPVALAVGAIAGSAVLLRRNWDGISAWWAGLWDGLDGDVGAFAGRLVSSLGDLADDFITSGASMAAGFVQSISGGIRNLIGEINWPTTADIARSAVAMIQGFASVGDLVLGGLINVLNTGIRSLVSAIRWATGAEITTGASGFIAGFGTVATTATGALIEGISDKVRTIARDIDWPGVVDLVRGAARFISSFGSLALTAAAALAGGIGAQMRSLAGDIQWPSAAEIGRGAAQLVLAFGALAIDAVVALTDAISRKMRTVGSDTEWPTANEILAGAGSLIVSFVRTATTVVAAFVSELSVGIGRSITEVDWPSFADIVRGATSLIRGFIDVGGVLVNALAQGLIGVGAAAINGIKEGLSGAGSAVSESLAGMVESIPIVGQRMANEMRGVGQVVEREAVIAGENIAEGTEKGMLSRFGSLFGVGEEAGEEAIAGLNAGAGNRSPSIKGYQAGGFIIEGAVNGVNDSAGTLTAATEAAANAATRSFERILSGLDDQITTFTGVTEGARKYGDEWERLNQTQRDSINDKEAILRGLQEEKRLRDELSAGIKDAIVNAEGIKDAFKGVGDFMVDWLKDKAQTFLANKITAFLVADTSGAEAGLGSFLSTAKTILSQLGGGFGDMLGGLFDKVKGFFGSGGGAGDGVLGNATSSFTSLAGSAATTAGQIAAMGVASFKIGESLGELVGGNGKGAGIGALLGGPFGTLVGSLFGGSFETTAVGAQVGFSGGQVTGNNVELQEKQRSFWRGTERREILTELDAEISSMVGEYFDNINTTLVQSASDLGVAGADNILASFEVATERFTGDTASEDLAAWLETSTLLAYQHAYTRLGPEVQTIIGGMVDIHTANAEDIAAAFDAVGAAAGTIVPELDLLGQLLSGTADEQAAYAFQLSEAMGGVGETMQALDLFAREFAPAGLEAARALETAQASLIEWNNEINSLEFEVPQISATGTANVFASDFGGGGFGATEAPQLGAIDQSVTVTNGYFETLIKNLSAGGAHANVAALALQNFVVSTDSATGAITLNRSGLDEYAAALSHGNDVQQAASNALGSVTNSLERFGEISIAGSDGLIDTREEMVNYIDALRLAKDTGEITTAQYAELHAASLQQLDDIIAVENALREQTEIFDSFSQTAQTLGLNFDPANAGAAEMANNLVDMFGSLDAFNASTASYFDNFFSAEEQQKIALAQSAVSVTAFNDSLIAAGGSAITGNDQFRQYVEGLDLASTTGQQAFLSAMQVQEAFAQVGESGQSASDILAQTPADILSAATAFDVAATTAANDAQFMQVAVNEATSLMANTSVETVSEMNQNVISLNSAANEVTLAMTSEHQQTLASQQQASLAQIKAEDIRARAEQLDLTTESGRAQYALLQQYADNTIASTGVMVDNVRGQVDFMKDGTVAAFTNTKDIVIGESMQLKDGVAGAFTNTKDIVLGTSAQLKDGVAGAFVSTKDIAISAANESKNTWSSAATGISGSAGTAASALGNTTGALGTIGNAAQAAANSVASASQRFYNTTGLQAQAFTDWFQSNNNIGGSFMTGLDRVPYDGFIAEVHEGEMIPTANVSNQLRALGVTATSIPEGFGQTRTVTNVSQAPAAPASNNSELKASFEAMTKELEMLRRDNMQILGSIAQSNNVIAIDGKKRTEVLKDVEKEQERTNRRLRAS